MVDHYCASLANALAAVADIDGGTLADGASATEPTLADATYLWDRASTTVQVALLRESLSVTLTAASISLELARNAETLWASLLVLTSKSSLLEGQEKSAKMLLELARGVTGYTDKDGRWVQGDFGQLRQVLIAQGATEELTAADTSRARTSAVEGADPNFDVTPGGDDVPYLPQPTFEDGDPL